MLEMDLSEEAVKERFLGPRGQRKSLKRLNPDKEIKVNSFEKFGRILLDAVPTWLDLGKFRSYCALFSPP